MPVWNLLKKFAVAFLYTTGLIGAMTTAFGATQALFSNRLINVVALSGNPCDPGEETLRRWEKSVSSNIGQFVYLVVDISETLGACGAAPIGEYPFMTKSEDSSLIYTIPLQQPIAANFMPRLQLPVSDASEALLANGFLNFYESADLIGNGVFFVDLLDNPHTGPLYRLVPAPFSVEAIQMHSCTSSYIDASGFLARSQAFLRYCIISF